MALSTDKSSKPYVRYLPFVPNGEVNIPPSKSDVHRAIICAALTRGKCTIAPVALSNDIKATIGVIEDMGCTASIKDGVLTVDGTNIFKTDNVTENVYKSFFEKKALNFNDIKTSADMKILQVSMFFDLNFKYSYDIIKEKDYFNILIDRYIGIVKNEETIEKYKEIKKFMNEYLESR